MAVTLHEALTAGTAFPFPAVFAIGAVLGGALGVLAGRWSVLALPLPRPWRPAARAYRRLLADIGRLLETGRWTGPPAAREPGTSPPL